MSGGVYCALGIALFLATLAAYSTRVFGPLRVLAGFVGMAMTLLTPQFLALAAVVSAICWRLGAFESTAGQVGAALHLASALALVALQWRMNRALPVLDGHEVGDDEWPFPDSPTERAFVPTLGPSLFLRTQILSTARVERAVEFRRVGRRRLVLDVYRPPQGFEPKPAIVYVHGGGWASGSRRQSRFMCAELASRGFPVFAISYRFAPFAGLKEIISDCKAGLAWVRLRQGDYGADERTLVMGGSAGGHLAAMLALTPNERRFQPGFEDADTSVNGGVILYGVTELSSVHTTHKDPLFAWFLRMVVRSSFARQPELWRELEPVSWASESAPAMLFVHGLADGVVPLAHSKLLLSKLKEAGAREASLLEVPLGHHAFEVMPTIMQQRAVRLICGWCEQVSKRPASVVEPLPEGALSTSPGA